MRTLFVLLTGYGAIASDLQPLTMFSNGECVNSLSAVFVRKRGWIRAEIGKFVKGDMVKCASYCRQNVLPSSSAEFPCSGFNFQPGKNTECELFGFFSESAASQPKLSRTEQLAFYFEKICLRVPHGCSNMSAFVFDARPGYTLRTNSASKVWHLGSDLQCAQACVNEDCPIFVWDADNRKCILTKSVQDGSLEKRTNSTYYENNCFTHREESSHHHEPACSSEAQHSSSIALSSESYKLLHRNRTLRQEFRIVQHLLTRDLNTCWMLCRNATTFMCRMFSYSASRRECMVSANAVETPPDYQKFTQESSYFDLFVRNTLDSYENTLRQDEPEQPIPSARQPTLPNTPLDQLEIKKPAFDPELQQLITSSSIPRLVTLPEGLGFVQPDAVSVQVACLENGMNVSFLLSDPQKKYTGAVYAAERFEQCRVFVKSSNRFTIFIPRPQHNTWCNALEIDEVLSALIVMSNDRVLPHDITTKDDLFFHVTCNYMASPADGVYKGTVVGGPLALSNDLNKARRQLSLLITKKGRPVDSVFIGESLVARVESDISADRLRIVECAVKRVGGIGPPASVALIADGCPLLPSLMAPMKLGENGWESSLSAFRFDGSEQINVFCMVVVCEDEACPSLSCPPKVNRSTRSPGERQSVFIDHRLIVKTRTAENPQMDYKVFSGDTRA